MPLNNYEQEYFQNRIEIYTPLDRNDVIDQAR